MALSFFVSGVPAPQGSKRHVGNGRMIEASKKVAPWRAAVFDQTRDLVFEKFTIPVSVEVTFFLTKPSSVKRLLPSVPPDLDKLERGLFDALTIAGIWQDDALVVECHSAKRYAGQRGSGAMITVAPFERVENTLV